MAKKEKRTWMIEVCKTCSRLAQWPYCAHRPTTTNEWSVPQVSWTETVRVREC